MKYIQSYKGWKILQGIENGQEFYLAYSRDTVETLGADTLEQIINKIGRSK